MKRSVKKSMLAGLATLSVVALSACGASSSASPAAGGKPGLTKINVGVIPIVDTAPIWLGKKKGFFAAEGLDITIARFFLGLGFDEGEWQSRDEMSVSEGAAALGVTPTTVLRLIRLKQLPASQACVGAPWIQIGRA